MRTDLANRLTPFFTRLYNCFVACGQAIYHSLFHPAEPEDLATTNDGQIGHDIGHVVIDIIHTLAPIGVIVTGPITPANLMQVGIAVGAGAESIIHLASDLQYIGSGFEILSSDSNI